MEDSGVSFDQDDPAVMEHVRSFSASDMLRTINEEITRWRDRGFRPTHVAVSRADYWRMVEAIRAPGSPWRASQDIRGALGVEPILWDEPGWKLLCDRPWEGTSHG